MYISIKFAKNLRDALKLALSLEIIILIISILYINQLPTINELSSDTFSPQIVNSNITWIAETYDKDGDNIFYRFYLKGPSTGGIWCPTTDWININNWTWHTSYKDLGESQVKVQIRDGNHAGTNEFDHEKTASFSITKPLLVIRSLIPLLSSPQAAGSEITWTADAHDPAGGRLYYRFSLIGPSTEGRRTLMRDWTRDNSWVWVTKPTEVGNYQVWVEAKREESTDSEAYESKSFTLTNSPPKKLTLKPDKTDLQVYGTAITWMATASDPNSDTIYYRFLLSGPSTGNTWRIMQPWSTSNTWNWVTSSLSIGDNEIKVQIRDDYSGDLEEFDKEDTASYTIVSEQQSQTSQMSPASPPQEVDYTPVEYPQAPIKQLTTANSQGAGYSSAGSITSPSDQTGSSQRNYNYESSQISQVGQTPSENNPKDFSTPNANYDPTNTAEKLIDEVTSKFSK